MRAIAVLVTFTMTLTGFVLQSNTLPAEATTCSVPSTFVNGTTADANAVNANFSSLVSCGNSIDNTNIGSNGIYASQIKPTNTVQATFGGTIGYVINPNTNGIVPLTILNAASPGADYIDITDNTSAKIVWIDSTGLLHTNQGPTFPALFLNATGVNTVSSNTTGSAVAFVFNNNNGTPTTGDLADFRSGGSNEFQILNGGGFTAQGNGTVNGTLTVNGSVIDTPSFLRLKSPSANNIVMNPQFSTNPQVLIGFSSGVGSSANPNNLAICPTGTSTCSSVAPVYTSSGGAVATTLHGAIGTCAFVSTSACVVNLSGNAVFSSNSSFSCGVMDRANSIAAGAVWTIIPLTSTGNTFTLESTNSNSDTMLWQCLGT